MQARRYNVEGALLDLLLKIKDELVRCVIVDESLC